MAWVAILGVFLTAAFATYALFANAAEHRGMTIGELFDTEPLGGTATLASREDLGMSARLRRELEAAAGAGESSEGWLRQSRVPYGQCTSNQGDCDMKTRCVQCEFFETTEADVPALDALRAQELELADRALEARMPRKAEIHRQIAASIEPHLRQYRDKRAV